jgi:hypothetical protein
MAHSLRGVVAAILAAFSAAGAAQAQPAGSAYPALAPIVAYRMTSPADEIALARSAAPPSLSADAEILVLGAHAYESAVPGKNGFICLIQRSWSSGLDDAEFWNPKERTPICFNPAAARSILPTYLERTRWVLAGATRAEILDRTRDAVAAGRYAAPEIGAMSYMLSRLGYLSDDAGGPWHPHLMLFLPSAAVSPAAWGANLPGSPVLGVSGGALDPVTVIFIPVRKWSDGTPDAEASPAAHAMAMTAPPAVERATQPSRPVVVGPGPAAKSVR